MIHLKLIREFFQVTFKEEKMISANLQNLQFNKISEHDQCWLERDFIIKEIVQALKSCNGSKAPGPDGFNLGFIKRCWKMMENEMEELMKEFHKDGKFNKALIVLSLL